MHLSKSKFIYTVQYIFIFALIAWLARHYVYLVTLLYAALTFVWDIEQ